MASDAVDVLCGQLQDVWAAAHVAVSDAPSLPARPPPPAQRVLLYAGVAGVLEDASSARAADTVSDALLALPPLPLCISSALRDAAGVWPRSASLPRATAAALSTTAPGAASTAQCIALLRSNAARLVASGGDASELPRVSWRCLAAAVSRLLRAAARLGWTGVPAHTTAPMPLVSSLAAPVARVLVAEFVRRAAMGKGDAAAARIPLPGGLSSRTDAELAHALLGAAAAVQLIDCEAMEDAQEEGGDECEDVDALQRAVRPLAHRWIRAALMPWLLAILDHRAPDDAAEADADVDAPSAPVSFAGLPAHVPLVYTLSPTMDCGGGGGAEVDATLLSSAMRAHEPQARMSRVARIALALGRLLPDVFAYCDVCLASARMEQLFDAIRDYPDSLPAITDLAGCIRRGGEALGRRVAGALCGVIASRLHHQGAATPLLIDFMLSTLTVCNLLDPSARVTAHVACFMGEYLSTRKNAVRCIVTSLSRDTESELYRDLQKGGAHGARAQATHVAQHHVDDYGWGQLSTAAARAGGAAGTAEPTATAAVSDDEEDEDEGEGDDALHSSSAEAYTAHTSLQEAGGGDGGGGGGGCGLWEEATNMSMEVDDDDATPHEDARALTAPTASTASVYEAALPVVDTCLGVDAAHARALVRALVLELRRQPAHPLRGYTAALGSKPRMRKALRGPLHVPTSALAYGDDARIIPAPHTYPPALRAAAAALWVPPSTASLGQRALLGAGSDTLSILVSVFGSPEPFVDEYRQLMSEELLAKAQGDFDIESSESMVELLKLRFGEDRFTSCEIMLRDVQDSKRVSSELRSRLAHVEHMPTVDVLALSHHYWPSMALHKATLHPYVEAVWKPVADTYATLRQPRHLVHMPGQSVLQLCVTNPHTQEEVEVTCNALQASVLMFVAEAAAPLRVDALAAAMSCTPAQALKYASHWLSNGTLHLQRGVPGVSGGDELTWANPETSGTNDAGAVAGAAEAGDEEVDAQEWLVFHSFIVGMLTSLGSLPADRIHNNLQLFASMGSTPYEKTASELAKYLSMLVRKGELRVADGAYALAE